MSTRARLIKATGIGVLCLCLGAAAFVVFLYQYAVSPVHSSQISGVVWIRPGQSFPETVRQLQNAGFVKHPQLFRWIARYRGDDRHIRAGEYQFQTSMTPKEILDALVSGKTLLHRVVIPEGSTMEKIGGILESVGLVSQQDFLQAASDPGLVEALGVEGATLEGYLFPETYHFPRGVTAEEVIRKMVSVFRSVFIPRWKERAQTLGLSVREVVTLASMVEKETDPTVIYGMKDFDGNLTRGDLETFTPYNTYLINGLPPGPIANPGRASLEAVLYPSEKPYLYFVSKNNGSHHFSRTFSEHNQMVRRYQRRGR
jgi:UPF0755 protein